MWETKIEYTQSYVYDHNLVFGAAYIIVENQPVLVINVSQEFEKVGKHFYIRKTADSENMRRLSIDLT
ncbi:MAG: hypothetical protein NWE85_03190, partial [Candidatus Bathyarchaeota archaeon]|nr:hypothetical protein [Candidatus Bathyarchaeota archaeon]